MHRNGQPDDVEEEVEHNYPSRNFEYVLVSAGIEVIHADGDEEYALGDDPLYGAELDVVGVRGKVEAEDCDFGEDEVGSGLTVCSYEGGPRGARPPSYNETKQTSIAGASRFCGPTRSVLDVFNEQMQIPYK